MARRQGSYFLKFDGTDWLVDCERIENLRTVTARGIDLNTSDDVPSCSPGHRLYVVTSIWHYRLRLISISLALCTAVLVVDPLVAQASVKNPNVRSVLKATRAAISKESGVHVTHTSKSGSTSASVVADIGQTSGTEHVTSGSENVTITVTPSYAYLSGNKAGLGSIMGLSSAEQKGIGSDWLTMKAGTTPYKDLAASATISLVTSMLPSVKGTTYSADNLKNTKEYQLSWTTKATSSTPKEKSVFTISAAKAALPIKSTISTSSGAGTTTFSKWGERVTVTTPPSSSTIAYSKVFGS